MDSAPRRQSAALKYTSHHGVLTAIEPTETGPGPR